jgi:HNH endonuclease
MSEQDKFWKNVKFTETCWRWTGCTSKGYGVFYYRGSPQRAHRLSWGWRYFPIPDDLCVDHLCKVKSCIRPDHVEIVTWAENGRRASRDAKAAGFAPRPSPPPPPAEICSRALPDSLRARAYFERRKVESDGGHWLIASAQKSGTPHLLIEGRLRPAHHLSYAWWCGPLRTDQVVFRTCGVPTCVHPDHLNAVTKGDASRAHLGGIERWRETHGPTHEERAAMRQARAVEAARLEAKALWVQRLAALMPEGDWLPVGR